MTKRDNFSRYLILATMFSPIVVAGLAFQAAFESRQDQSVMLYLCVVVAVSVAVYWSAIVYIIVDTSRIGLHHSGYGVVGREVTSAHDTRSMIEIIREALSSHKDLERISESRCELRAIMRSQTLRTPWLQFACPPFVVTISARHIEEDAGEPSTAWISCGFMTPALGARRRNAKYLDAFVAELSGSNR